MTRAAGLDKGGSATRLVDKVGIYEGCGPSILDKDVKS
jgi:hypothetical protein